jgi:hypothetical protein
MNYIKEVTLIKADATSKKFRVKLHWWGWPLLILETTKRLNKSNFKFGKLRLFYIVSVAVFQWVKIGEMEIVEDALDYHRPQLHSKNSLRLSRLRR